MLLESRVILFAAVEPDRSGSLKYGRQTWLGLGVVLQFRLDSAGGLLVL